MIAHMIAPHTILLSVFILAFLCSFFLYLLGFMKHEVINVYDRQGNHCFWFSFAGNEEFFSHLLKKIAEAPLEEGNPNNQMQNIGTNAPNSDL